MVRGCQVEFVKTPKQFHEPAWPRFSQGESAVFGRRDLQVAGKGSSGVCFGGRGPVPQPYVHSPQEGRVLQNDFQSETVKCVGTICSFQNGGHGGTDQSGSTQRLVLQNRSEGCVSLRGDGAKISVLLESTAIPVCEPPFRFSLGSEDVHQASKTGGGISETVGSAPDNLFGRHSAVKSESERNWCAIETLLCGFYRCWGLL